MAGEVGLQPFQLVMDHKHLTYILALGKKDFESSGALSEVDFSASWKNMSFSMHIVFEHCEGRFALDLHVKGPLSMKSTPTSGPHCPYKEKTDNVQG